MATMYPSIFPKEANTNDPEYEVFEILKKLPDNFSIFYSKKFKGGKRAREECEIDFLIFDGQDSLICLEVKGGKIEYNGKNDSWYQNNKKMQKGPDRQASAQPSSVIEFLTPEIKNLNVGWALCFPDCCLPEVFSSPSGVLPELIIDEDKTLNIEDSIGLIQRYYIKQHKRTGVSKADAQNIIKKLTRGIGFITKLGVRTAKDYQQILEATEEQFNILEDLELNSRVAVKGYAGTGKTLIATEFAKRLAPDKKVLLLFYNNPIAKNVRYGLDRDSRIECSTFHSFARHLINDEVWWKAQNKKDDDFWPITVPIKLSEAMTDDDAIYDAIIVDEGQDFKSEWYEALESLLKDSENGFFTVFYDEHQDIFNRWDDLPWSKSAFRKVLTKNCRNTKKIVHFLKSKNNKYDKMTTYDRSPEGLDVNIREVSSIEDEQKQFENDLAVTLKENVLPKNIIILSNKEELADSWIHDLKESSKHKVEGWFRGFWADKNVIYYTNIEKFKGMEADVVFILDNWDLDNEAFNEMLYVQGSRARSLLYIYKQETI